MNLFDRLVAQAMESDQALGIVRPALEKELLHHDIHVRPLEIVVERSACLRQEECALGRPRRGDGTLEAGTAAA